MAELLRPFAGENAGHIARRLLSRFGSLSRALSVCDEQLFECLNDHRQVGESIVAARSLVEAALREEITRSRVDAASPRLRQYLMASLRGRPFEELLAIFTDDDQGFLAEEVVATGGAHSVSVHNRPLLHRALELGAHGILLVHNHPSRQPRPSQLDVESTHRISRLVQAVDIHLIDHLIIAGNRICSMRDMELL